MHYALSQRSPKPTQRVFTVSIPAEIVHVRTMIHFYVLMSMLLRQAPALTTTISGTTSRVHRDFRELLAAWELIDLKKGFRALSCLNPHLTDKTQRRYRHENTHFSLSDSNFLNVRLPRVELLFGQIVAVAARWLVHLVVVRCGHRVLMDFYLLLTYFSWKLFCLVREKTFVYEKRSNGKLFRTQK